MNHLKLYESFEQKEYEIGDIFISLNTFATVNAYDEVKLFDIKENPYRYLVKTKNGDILHISKKTMDSVFVKK